MSTASRHPAFSIMLLASLTLLANPAAAQAAQDEYPPPRHEFLFGLGLVVSGEDDVLNVPSIGLSSKPAFGFNGAYRFYKSPTLGFGVHTYGGSEKTDPIPVPTEEVGVFQADELDLVTYNSGVHVVLVRPRGNLRLYAAGGLSYAYGSIDSAALGTLYYTGFSAFVAPGLSLRVGSRFAIGVEGMASFGSATWDQEPFTNSESDEFDPSLYGGHLTVSIPWGDASGSARP